MAKINNNTITFDFKGNAEGLQNTLAGVINASFDNLDKRLEKTYNSIYGFLNKLKNNISSIFNLVTGFGSALSFADSLKDLINYQDKFFAKLYQMGNSVNASLTGANDMFLKLKATSAETGIQFEKLAETSLSVLNLYLTNSKEVAMELSKQIEATSLITGVSSNAILNLSESMLKFNKNLQFTTADTKKMNEYLVAFQRATGLSSQSMEKLSNDMALVMKKAGGMFDSKIKVEAFGKSVLNLGGYFEKLGIDVSKAANLVDSFIDPLKMEKNLALLTRMGYAVSDILRGNVGGEDKLGMGIEKFAKQVEAVAKTNRFAAAQMAQQITGGEFTLDELMKISKQGYSAFAKEKAAKQPKTTPDLFNEYLKDRNETIAQKIEIIKNKINYIFSEVAVKIAGAIREFQNFFIKIINFFQKIADWITKGSLATMLLKILLVVIAGNIISNLFNKGIDLLLKGVSSVFSKGIAGLINVVGKNSAGKVGGTAVSKVAGGSGSMAEKIEDISENTKKVGSGNWTNTFQSIVKVAAYGATLLAFLFGLSLILPKLAKGFVAFKEVSWKEIGMVGAVVGAIGLLGSAFSLLGAKGILGLGMLNLISLFCFTLGKALPVLGKGIAELSKGLTNINKTMIGNLALLGVALLEFGFISMASVLPLVVGSLGILSIANSLVVLSKGLSSLTQSPEEIKTKLTSVAEGLNAFIKFKENQSFWEKAGNLIGGVFEGISAGIKGLGTAGVGLGIGAIGSGLNKLDINKFSVFMDKMANIGLVFKDSAGFTKSLNTLKDFINDIGKNDKALKTLNAISAVGSTDIKFANKIQTNTQLKDILSETVNITKPDSSETAYLKRIFVLLQQYVGSKGLS